MDIMDKMDFKYRLNEINKNYEQLISIKNTPLLPGNGIFLRYKNPVLTAAHTPPFWRYDLNPKTNPFLMERIGINAVMNSAAIKWDGKYLLMARMEGVDRKSFFAIAESPNGIDNFRFWDYPVIIPENEDPATNVYDMRLTLHEDGWIYGLFCVERFDETAEEGDLSKAKASAGVVRTKDMINWERLPDVKSRSQQRNVVLHPEFIEGKYALYTRPQDGFINAGSGLGIGFGLTDSMEEADISKESIIDEREYHTIKELKNGQGPAPIKTDKGWIHIAHGVRNTAAGLRYVLYLFMTDLQRPDELIYAPGGYFLAPQGQERVGDVSNVVFCNGAIARENGDVYIYYASSDTRCHVAKTTVDKLLDYCINTPADPARSYACVKERYKLIEENLKHINKSKNPSLKMTIL